jgi:hypothetical protein
MKQRASYKEGIKEGLLKRQKQHYLVLCGSFKKKRACAQIPTANLKKTGLTAAKP